ncbi:DUF6283 family protein [Micromonospora sp. CPCC 206061]|uniref:DUF6283 family protein n=1 Tax=Micromonospora sp. CPCC 206061 TaxID=3122410 RepID=UPI002FF1B046
MPPQSARPRNATTTLDRAARPPNNDRCTVAPAVAGAPATVRVCARPCRSCPWRRDTAGRFRYDNLADYAAGTIPGAPGFGRPVDGDPAAAFGTLFACHHLAETSAHLCAGWLAVHGAEHPAVRLGLAVGLIDPAALTAGEDWPELFECAAEMLAAHDPHASTTPETELMPR